MEMMHQNFQFLNGTWLVKEIDGQAVDVPDMKLVIDVDEGKLHGNTLTATSSTARLRPTWMPPILSRSGELE